MYQYSLGTTDQKASVKTGLETPARQDIGHESAVCRDEV